MPQIAETGGQPIGDMYKDLLALVRLQHLFATGLTPADYLYAEAEEVRRSDIQGYVFVTYQGKQYGPAYAAAGALDGSEDKSTVLINTKSEREKGTDHWVRLEYMTNSVLPADVKLSGASMINWLSSHIQKPR